MLSYQHAFHAGNFGDVLKHAVAALVVEALKGKSAPFCCLDTHAGGGRYDLHGARAMKNAEWQDGIGLLWGREPHPALEPYLEVVTGLNPDGVLRYYPGSPWLLRRLLRGDDRLVLTELHGTEHTRLKRLFARDRQVAAHQLDAHQALKALLPPKERRGFVLIDPAYEVRTEAQDVVAALQAAHRRWPTGVYALWYPVLSRESAPQVPTLLAASGMRKLLLAELCLHGEGDVAGLRGAGVVLLNPPWHLQGQLEALLPWLWHILSPRQRGGHRVSWLAPE